MSHAVVRRSTMPSPSIQEHRMRDRHRCRYAVQWSVRLSPNTLPLQFNLRARTVLLYVETNEVRVVLFLSLLIISSSFLRSFFPFQSLARSLVNICLALYCYDSGKFQINDQTTRSRVCALNGTYAHGRVTGCTLKASLACCFAWLTPEECIQLQATLLALMLWRYVRFNG